MGIHNWFGRKKQHSTRSDNSSPVALEQLEPRLLLSTTEVLLDIFEYSDYMSFRNNWDVNVDEGRVWGPNTAKVYSGSYSVFASDDVYAPLSTAITSHTYVNSQSNYMRRTINLSDYDSATMTLRYYTNTESGYDGFRVNVDGSTVSGTNREGNSGGWQRMIVDLTPNCGSSNVDLELSFYSDSSYVPSGYAGVWIDNLYVTGTTNDTYDLRGSGCILGASGLHWGDSVNVSGQVRNLGNSTVSTNFTQKFYLSNDTTFGDADDIYLRSYSHTANIGGTSLGPSFNTSLTLPSSAPSGYNTYGTFYIGMKTDANDNVDETNESNNSPHLGDPGWELVDWDEFRISQPVPNIVYGGAVSEATAEEGESFRVTAEIKNTGGASAGTTHAKAWLSTDNDNDTTDDYYLGEISVAALAPEASAWSSWNFTMPNIGSGSYSVSVLFQVDSRNEADGAKLYKEPAKFTAYDATGDPNDQISEAVYLGSMTQTRSVISVLDSDTDVDMYSFAVTAGQRVSFDIDRSGGSPLSDSWIRLFNSSGTQLDYNDDGTAPGESRSYDSFLEYTFATAGTYYLGVSGYRNASYSATGGTGDVAGSTGSYTLILTPFGGSTNDNNDQISEAMALGAMTQTRTVSGAIDPSTDVDMYSFAVTAGQRVSFDIDRNGSSPLSDSWIRLFNSSGTQLDYNDDGTAPGESRSYDSFLEYTFATAGTYYLGVSGYRNASYSPTDGSGDRTGSTGSYTLILTPFGGSTNDNNDQISEAMALGAMTQTRTVSGAIDPSTDVDMYSFAVTAGQQVNFDIDRNGSSPLSDSWIRLFNSSGTQLDYSDDDAAPNESNSRESFLGHTFSTAGTYYLGVSGYRNAFYSATGGTGDVAGSTGGYTLVLTSAVNDWFSQNLLDPELTILVRSRAADGHLSRNDMIEILRDAGDGNVVNSEELRDLRKLVTNASSLGMPDYVRVLTDHTVNVSTANQHYQGAALGNLAAGSSASHLENLIGKWFLGNDLPEIHLPDYTYEAVSGSLFVDGPSYTDIGQSARLGDCYLMAALAATAESDPTAITSMFIDNGDETYTVRLYNNSGNADYVTVNRELPVSEWGSTLYAEIGGDADDASNELWVALAEKAYAQVNEQGEIGQDGTNSYFGIDWGKNQRALAHITGRSVTVHSIFPWSSEDGIVSAINNGYSITLGSDLLFVAQGIWARHAYTVIGYDSVADEFELFNLYGYTQSISWTDLRDSFKTWAYVAA